MLPSDVNNCARENMAALKRDWNRHNPTVTSGGSANVQTLTYTTAPTAYVQGQTFCFIAGFTNTGATTLNVNALGAKNVFLDGVALAGGEIVATQIVECAYDGTQFQIISGRAIASLSAGGKNLLVNPSFEVWQRGAGGSASFAIAASGSQYTSDCWYFGNGANQASVVSQVAGLTNQSQWAAKVQRNSGQTGTGVMTFEQPLELNQIIPLRGQIVTVSVWLKAGANFSAASNNLVCKLYCGTGAAAKRVLAAYTSETAPVSATQAITTSAVKYTFVSSVIVPTTTTQMSLQFSFTPVGTAGADDSFTIDDVQPEIGGVATAYDPLGWDFSYQLSKCQRYYWKTFPYATAPAQNAGTGGCGQIAQVVGASTGQNGPGVTYPTRTRVVASGTIYNPSATNAQFRNTSTGTDCASSAVAAADDWGTGFSFTTPGGSAAGQQIIFHLTVDAAL